MVVKPKIIAGPCSAETREQILNTASQLSSDKIDFFERAYGNPGLDLEHSRA